MKKFLSITLIIILLSGTVFIPGLSPRVNAAFDFKCGDNATWSYDVNTYTLTISGTGSTYEYEVINNNVPWIDYKEYIKTVEIEEGITRLGQFTLRTLPNAVTLKLPSTLRYLGALSKSFTTIRIPDDNSLTFVTQDGYFALNKTKWYSNKANGAVYLGKVFVGYKGTIAENVPLIINEGTLGIAPEALKGQQNLSEIVFPDTIEYVGNDAFAIDYYSNIPWLANQDYGPLYIGKCFYRYIGEFGLDERDFVIRAGTVSIAGAAASFKVPIDSVTIPQSVEYIGDSAFAESNITDVIFENNSKAVYIGNKAFYCSRYIMQEHDISLPDIQYLSYGAFTGRHKLNGVIYFGKDLCYLNSSQSDFNFKFVISSDNQNYFSDDDGTVYDKSKETLVHVPYCVDYTVPETVKTILAYAFSLGAKNIELPDDLQKISNNAFSGSKAKSIDFGYSEPEMTQFVFGGLWTTVSNLESITVRSMTLTFPEKSLDNSKLYPQFAVRCYPNSAMQTWCETNGINYELLDDNPMFVNINAALDAANAIDRSLYTSASLNNLDSTVSQVDLNMENLTEEQLDEWVEAIYSALSALEYLPADYTAISEALAAANSLNRSLYTADSLLSLDYLVLNVDYSLNITQQSDVDSYAADIIAAVNSLVYRDADYSAVNIAVSNALAVDRTQYTEQSFANLEIALRNVEYGLDITYQAKVNAFAEGINYAISALVAKPADYSNVESAIQRANSINRNLYTAESLALLDAAV
ncbi:MAG: leucine-rich repeat protein, partial [Clostridia bacterium]|nr:leucine-rich repeat protein [Clostridia bacterium]